MSVVGLVPWRLVAQAAWRHFEMLTDEKERKKLEAYMMRPLAPLPLSAGTTTAPQNGWAPKPYQKGQQGELLNG